MRTMNLSGVDLNLLPVLDALLAERSVSRAARRCGLSQPATSHALRRLRELLSDELLVRVGRAMVATPRALELAPALASALGALDRVIAAPAAFDARTTERTFRIAAADLQQVVLLPGVLGRLVERAPRFDLVVDPASHHIADRIRAGQLDLGIALLRSSDRGGPLAELPFLRDRFVCLARRGHPLTKKRRVDVRAFAAAKHAFIAPGGARGGAVDDALRQLGLTRRIAFQAAQFLVAPYVIAETDLVITLPEQAARLLARRLPVVTFEPPVRLPTFQLSMVWHERFTDDPAHELLREVIADVARRTATTLGRGRSVTPAAPRSTSGGRTRQTVRERP